MIAIKGIDMPKNCSDCELCHGHICKITGTDIITNPKGNCPLVEIITCKGCEYNNENTCYLDGYGINDDYFCACAERNTR